MDFKKLFGNKKETEPVPRVIFSDPRTEEVMGLFLEERRIHQISHTFGLLLKRMGFNEKETFFLSLSTPKDPKEGLIFNGTTNSHQFMNFYCDDSSYISKIKLEQGRSTKTYEYTPRDLFSKRFYLFLIEETFQEAFIDHCLETKKRNFCSSYTLQTMNGYTVELNLRKPQQKEFEDEEMEREIRDYLLHLEFPCDLLEIYKTLAGFLDDPHSVTLKLTDPDKKKSFLDLNGNVLKKLHLSYPKWNVSYSEEKGWIYQSPKFFLEENQAGELAYHVPIFDKDHIRDAIPFDQDIQDGILEVEKVKQLSKSIF